MKRAGFGLLFTLVLTMSATTTQAALVTLDFDSFSDGTVLAGNAFAGLGVVFDQQLEVDDGDQGGLALSTPNYVLNADSFGGSITGIFSTAVDFVSVFAGDSGGDFDTVTLNGYDASNVLVDTATFGGNSAQTLSISGAGIVRFEVLQTNLVAYDNFTFNTADVEVPEPASLTLLSLGGLGLVAARRRRRAA